MIFLIGHRGVGKTKLGAGLENSFDLDSLIGSEEQIQQIFSEKGESYFRKLEFKTLDRLLTEKKPKTVVLGAGFNLKNYVFPKEAVFFWIQRASDETGRIFLNRPRLLKDMDPLEEFLTLKVERDKVFQEFADFKFLLEEGEYTLEASSKRLKKLINGDEHGDRQSFYTPAKISELDFYKGPTELRTDVFSEAEILNFLEKKVERDLVVALRNKKPSKDFLRILESKNILMDAPLELYPGCDFKYKADFFLSLHENLPLEELKKALDQVDRLKWSPTVNNFEELVQYDTLIKNEAAKEKKISFLPRDQENLGHYKWYRTACRDKNFVNYFRYGLTPFLDQPAYFDLTGSKDKSLGAVFGGDTGLSHSPAFHRSFFLNHADSNYVSVSLKNDSADLKNVFHFLKGKNIKFLSVTSPYKNNVAKLTQSSEPQNTVFLGQDEVKSLNTDKVSIAKLIERVQSLKLKVCVWGGGAMGQYIFDHLSTKEKQIRSIRDSADVPVDAQVIIWTCGAETEKFPIFKSQTSPLKCIFDLEYKEHSFARKLALQTGAKYISGVDFFIDQAEAQQKFFSHNM